MPFPLVVIATEAEPRAKISDYPAPFAQMIQGRSDRVLEDLFKLTNFGVNLTTLQPGSRSALQHRHSLDAPWSHRHHRCRLRRYRRPVAGRP